MPCCYLDSLVLRHRVRIHPLMLMGELYVELGTTCVLRQPIIQSAHTLKSQEAVGMNEKSSSEMMIGKDEPEQHVSRTKVHSMDGYNVDKEPSIMMNTSNESNNIKQQEQECVIEEQQESSMAIKFDGADNNEDYNIPARILPCIVYSQFAGCVWFAGNAVITEFTFELDFPYSSLQILTSAVTGWFHCRYFTLGHVEYNRVGFDQLVFSFFECLGRCDI